MKVSNGIRRDSERVAFHGYMSAFHRFRVAPEACDPAWLQYEVAFGLCFDCVEIDTGKFWGRG